MARKKAAGRAATARPKRKAGVSRRRKPARAAKRARKTAPKKLAARRPAARPRTRKASAARKRVATRSPARKAAPARASRKTKTTKTTKTAKAPRPARPRQAATARPAAPAAAPRTPRLDRQRRILREEHGVPSSLDLDRGASSVRTGREEFHEHQRHHANLSPSITAGDVDASVENAYFSGDEAPGGDNPTPDQDVVDEIGQALGIQYQDNEELQGGEEVSKRDRHRWEFDPASSEDYRERKNER